jgi:hypothetical protein
LEEVVLVRHEGTEVAVAKTSGALMISALAWAKVFDQNLASRETAVWHLVPKEMVVCCSE